MDWIKVLLTPIYYKERWPSAKGFKGQFFPHSWEDIYSEIAAARCYILQEFIKNFTLMCYIAFKLQTLSKNYIAVFTKKDCSALKEKQYFLLLSVN